MATKAKGTLFQFGNTADIETATTWTTVAVVKSIKPGKRMAKEIETTTLESDAEEFIPGLPSVGDSELTLQYTKDQAEDLDGLFNTLKAWRVLYPDSSGSKWNGFITEDGEEEITNGEIIMSTIKIKPTGDRVRFYTTA
jgi:hypothetical protein